MKQNKRFFLPGSHGPKPMADYTTGAARSDSRRKQHGYTGVLREGPAVAGSAYLLRFPDLAGAAWDKVPETGARAADRTQAHVPAAALGPSRGDPPVEVWEFRTFRPYKTRKGVSMSVTIGQANTDPHRAP